MAASALSLGARCFHTTALSFESGLVEEPESSGELHMDGADVSEAS